MSRLTGQRDDETVVGSAGWWRAWADRQARRRPRSGGLTADRIVEAALGIVDAEGLDALTVRHIAERLGTGSATLYRHVESREELLELLVDHVIGEVQLPPPGERWRQKVELLAGELRRALMAHAGLVPALATSPLLGPNARRGTECGLASLMEAGLEPEVAVSAYRALIDYVLGTVFFDTSRAGRGDRGGDGAGSDGAGTADDAYPTLLAHKSLIASTSGEAVFRFGLGLLLDGLEGRGAAA